MVFTWNHGFIFSWLGGGGGGGEIKINRRKTLINEDKEKQRIQGKSNNNKEHP